MAKAADSASLEAGAGESKPTPTIASSPLEYQKLVGRYEASDDVYVSGSVRAQHDFGASAAPGTTLATGPDWVWLLSLGAAWDVNKHVTLGADVSGSPPSSRSVASPFSYPSPPATLSSTALMLARSWSVGGSVDLTYDTFDEEAPHDVDGSVELSVGYTRFGTEQSMTEFDSPSGQPQDVGAFLAGCAATATPLCAAVQRASQQLSSGLGQWRLGATPTLTFKEETDAALDAALYVYDKNRPDQAGFYDYRLPRGGGEVATFGAGLPLIPPRWSLRPELGHRWKLVSVRGWYQLTDYTIPSYIGHAVGAKVQLYLDKWRIYATGSYRADVSLNGAEDNAQTWVAGVGVTRQF